MQTVVRIALALLMLLAVVCVAFLALVGVLAQTRPIINCSTVSNPAQFVADHPEYLNRLDRDHDGKPCEATKHSDIWLNL